MTLVCLSYDINKKGDNEEACIQTENGTTGARGQIGSRKPGVSNRSTSLKAYQGIEYRERILQFWKVITGTCNPPSCLSSRIHGNVPGGVYVFGQSSTLPDEVALSQV